jgi:hypothetical protein
VTYGGGKWVSVGSGGLDDTQNIWYA